MTNEDRRRASGAAMEASRRGTGSAMEASRRAGGDAMIERRTGKSVAEDINSLVNPPRQRKTLRSIDPVGALPARRGSGTYQAPATGTGGGIASPLTEKTKTVDGVDIPDREFWPRMPMSTSDGVFTLEVRPLKTWRFVDADGNDVQMNLAQPKAQEV